MIFRIGKFTISKKRLPGEGGVIAAKGNNCSVRPERLPDLVGCEVGVSEVLPDMRVVLEDFSTCLRDVVQLVVEDDVGDASIWLRE